MGYLITVEVEADECLPSKVRRLAAQAGGRCEPQAPASSGYPSTVVEFDNWENFLKFSSLTIGPLKTIVREHHQHWVSKDKGIVGVPYWAHSMSDEAQLFFISPQSAAEEVVKFIRHSLVMRALESEVTAAAVVERLIND